jgi:seryl-tRNA synthetase
MHDPKFVRENPQAFDAGLARRGLAPQSPAILEIDAKRRALLTRLQSAQARRNEIAKLIGGAKSKGDHAEAERLMAEVGTLKADIQADEAAERDIDAEVEAALASIPNLPDETVPQGRDETGNVEIRRVGTIPQFNFEPKQHFDLGEGLGQMDFEAAAKMSGARFVVLQGQLARLERALGNFMLDLHTSEFGYTEVSPPTLVKPEALFGTGQLPKFEEDLFQTTAGLWLIPTAEVSVTNLVRQSVLDEADLPLRFTAFTPCYRAEAGSAGRDTRGMIRLHQFSKVELVSITTPEQSDAEHERMVQAAEEVLKRLGLAYRTMLLCTGDMGFSARKTYDLEVWLPGQNTYREISSCSNCGDFQARRMLARAKAAGAKAPRLVHTLNGSGLAVGRTLVAVLENYQQQDGTIRVPEVLRPYLGGQEIIDVSP